jgi:hypothetical protein
MLGVFVFVVCLLTFIHKYQQRRFAQRAAARRAPLSAAVVATETQRPG